MNNAVQGFEQSDQFIVEARKYDSSIHRSWNARLVRLEEELIVLEGVFERDVRHALLGHIVRGTQSTEYFWTNRWYSIFRFREPSGELRNFYCNINQPAKLVNHMISFVDLDIDVLVAPDRSYQILDRDEFAENSRRFNYSPEVLCKAEEALIELIRLIEQRAFPFSDVEFL